MLTGQELVKFVKGNPEMNKSQLAKGAGYTRTDDEGKTVVLIQAFYDALLAAQGLLIKKGQLRGRAAANQVSVQRNGIVVLGKRYTSDFGVNPGDTFNIEMDDDAIRLVPTAA